MKFTIIIFTTSMLICGSALALLGYNYKSQVEEAPVIEVEEVPEFEEPLLTVVVHSAARIEEEVAYLIPRAGLPPTDFTELADEFSEFFDYIEAIDQTKPLAAMTFAEKEDSDGNETLFCFPVSDLDQFTAMLEKHGTVNECALGFVYKPNDGEKKLVRHEGDYVYMAHKIELLKILPPDLETLLRSLVGENLAAAKIDSRMVPAEEKEELCETMQNTQPKFLDLEESEYMSMTMGKTMDLVRDTEEVVLCLNIDHKIHEVEVKAKLSTKEGSPTSLDSARELALSPSQFSGFGNSCSSAVRFNFHSAIICDCLKGLKNDAMRSITSEPLTEDHDVAAAMEKMFDDTMKEENFEISANYFLEEKEHCLIVATHFYDTTPLRALIESLSEKNGKEANDLLAKMKVVEKYGDTTLINFVKDETEDILRELYPIEFNDQRIVGFDDQAMYFAIGANGIDHLKKCIDASKQATSVDGPTSSITLNVLPVISSLAPQFFTSELKKELSDEGDQLSLESSPIENGYEARLACDIAFVKATLGAIQGIGRVSEAKFQEISRELNAERSRKTRPVKTRAPRPAKKGANRKIKGAAKQLETVSSSTKPRSQKSASRKFQNVAESLESNPERQAQFQKGFNKGLNESLKRHYSNSPTQTDSTGQKITNPFINN